MNVISFNKPEELKISKTVFFRVATSCLCMRFLYRSGLKFLHWFPLTSIDFNVYIRSETQRNMENACINRMRQLGIKVFLISQVFKALKKSRKKCYDDEFSFLFSFRFFSISARKTRSYVNFNEHVSKKITLKSLIVLQIRSIIFNLKTV